MELAKGLGLFRSPEFEQLRSLQLLKFGRSKMAKRAKLFDCASCLTILHRCNSATVQNREIWEVQ